MTITAKMVSELREKTGAGMMDCKKALEAAGGDLDGAIDHLRRAGMRSAAKKASRETAEGRVFSNLAEDARRGHLVGLACETDFLSSSEGFLGFVEKLARTVQACDPDGVSEGERALLVQDFEDGGNVQTAIQGAVGQFGENIQVAQFVRMENAEGRVGVYIHHDKKQGAIVSVTTGADAEKAASVLKSLCQHIVVFPADYLNRDEVPGEALDREREVIAQSEEVKSKPENIRGKIVEGKLNRFYSERCLVDQPWIHDDKQSVGKFLEKALGAGTRIESFSRVKLG